MNIATLLAAVALCAACLAAYTRYVIVPFLAYVG